MGAPATQRGHAIEARVYAEDPEHGFLPQAAACGFTASRVRRACGSIQASPKAPRFRSYYDPLLAKVIAVAETRELARARLTAALRDFPILGIRTNLPFLLRILDMRAISLGRHRHHVPRQFDGGRRLVAC